jgi:hypothetical protein
MVDTPHIVDAFEDVVSLILVDIYAPSGLDDWSDVLKGVVLSTDERSRSACAATSDDNALAFVVAIDLPATILALSNEVSPGYEASEIGSVDFHGPAERLLCLGSFHGLSKLVQKHKRGAIIAFELPAQVASAQAFCAVHELRDGDENVLVA